MEEIIIRGYEARDRASLREIACDTAFIGKEAGVFFEGREILADFLTLYFTDYEAESCFVAESAGRVVGYLVGAKDTKILGKVFGRKILFGLIIKFIASGALFRRKNIAFIYQAIVSLLKGELKGVDLSAQYPATLHINMKEAFRGSGIGAKLIVAYLAYLKKNNIKGVYLATMSPEARSFFTKQGFTFIQEYKRTYFRYILHRDTPVYMYGKKV